MTNWMINQIANKLRIGEKKYTRNFCAIVDWWMGISNHPMTDQTTKAQKLTLPSAKENTSMNGWVNTVDKLINFYIRHVKILCVDVWKCGGCLVGGWNHFHRTKILSTIVSCAVKTLIIHFCTHALKGRMIMKFCLA